jgi:hypothetical protein
MKKRCIRDCYDTSTSLYYYAGAVYELEEGDIIAESKHFIDFGKKPPVTEEKAALDPALNKKTLKYLVKKYPSAAKKVDLRKKGAHRSMVYEIMKEQGTIESTEEEGKTEAEHLIEQKESKLAASRKR